MSALEKILKKAGIGGAVGLGLVVLLGLFVVSPILLIWGLNLMGFPIDYTWKTILGAILVILIIRPSGTSKNS
jgi:hypothetical protein